MMTVKGMHTFKLKITLCTVHCSNDILNRVHRVTSHNGGIPSDEVWLKLGGDEGGGTVKLFPTSQCFQSQCTREYKRLLNLQHWFRPLY